MTHRPLLLLLFLVSCADTTTASEAPAPAAGGAAGAGGAQETSGTGGQPTAGAAGSPGGQGGEAPGGAGGTAGAAGTGGNGGQDPGGAGGGGGAGGEAVTCSTGGAGAKMCATCQPYWTLAPWQETIDRDGYQLAIDGCPDKEPCAVFLGKYSGTDQVGAVMRETTCEMRVEKMRAGLTGAVDVRRAGQPETMRVFVTVGYQPACSTYPEPVDMGLVVTTPSPYGEAPEFGRDMGCSGPSKVAMGCPTFPDGALVACTECLTPPCEKIPAADVDAAREALGARLRNTLRRQIAAWSTGSCGEGTVDPDGEACVSPW